MLCHHKIFSRVRLKILLSCSSRMELGVVDNIDKTNEGGVDSDFAVGGAYINPTFFDQQAITNRRGIDTIDID